MRSIVAACSLLLFAGCRTRAPATPPPEPPPAPEQSGLEPEAPPQPAAAPKPAPEAIEPGFTHCCGDRRYKLEVDCGEMLKRCYERDGGEWHLTYGRHCKSELGDACYLKACESAC